MPPRGVRMGTKRARMNVPGRSRTNKIQLQRAVDGRK
jgi:hypothetical protein